MGDGVEVASLGPIEVHSDAGAVAVAGVRRQALVAILALAVPRPVSDDRLLDALWGDEPPANPANALQAQVSQLRRLLGNDVVVRDGRGYRLAVEPDAVDVHRLEHLVRDGRTAADAGDGPVARTHFAAAVALIRGPPLVELTDLPFARDEIAGLDALALDAEEGFIDAELEVGRHAEVVGRLTELVRDHPLRERFHAQLVLSLYRSGRQSEALRAHQAAREILLEELGVDPGPELAELEHAVLTHDAALLREVVAPRPAPVLPSPLSSFIGREPDLVELDEHLASSRLVTVVGTAGMGKTRLAVETARRRSAVGEVRFVELAPVIDPLAVPDAIATALGAHELSAEAAASVRAPEDRAVERIGTRSLLVVLDNVEHVAEAAAAVVTALLGGCPGLRILVTSREALGIAGEQLLVLGPMDGDDAACLFTDRAKAVQARFDAEASGADVAEVCRRLDGMPLAIELAAARTKALPVAEIAERLDDRFRLLRAGGGRDDDRTTGLRAAIDWSYDSLFEDERRAFCGLAVFAGGATVEAAETFCGPDALDLLDRLVDKSLLVADTSGPRARFRLLESLRAYGLDRLDEEGALRARADHLAWCTDRVETAAPHLRQSDQLPWLAELDAEHDNLRAALAFAATNDPVGGLRLLGPLILAWYFRGRAHEARHWIDELLAADDGSDPRARAMVLAWSGLVAESGTWNDEPQRIKLELLQPDSRAREALVADAGWSDHPGRVEVELRRAEARAREAIELYGDVDDLDLAQAYRMLVLSLVRQTTVGLTVDTDELAVLVPATIDRFTRLDEPYGLAIINVLASTLSLMRGDLEEAEQLRSAAEVQAQRSGERFCRSRVELLGAILAEAAGDLAAACEHVERGLRLLTEMRMESHVTAQAALAGRLAELMGDEDRAAQWRAFVAERDGARSQPEVPAPG